MEEQTRERDRTGWYCWWRWDVTVLPGIVWLIGIRSPLQCLDSNAMQSHMAIYIQWAPWAPHTCTCWTTHTPLCEILSLFLAQILVQVVVVAAVELVGFHVVFRYNFFPCFSFFIFSLCRNKYMYLTRAPTKKVVVGAEVPVLPFANSVSKHQPLFQRRG